MARALQPRGQLDQQLDLLQRRPDLPITLRIRTRLLKLIEKDLDWFWDQYKANIMYGGKDSTARAQLLGKIVDKILVEQRDVTSTDTPGPLPQSTTVIINGLDRGTLAARQPIETTARRVSPPPASTP